MAIDTGGGFYGGAASGLQSGLQLGSEMQARAADQQLRQQQFGLQQHEQARLDRHEQMELNQNALKYAQDQKDQLTDRIAGYAQSFQQAHAGLPLSDTYAAIQQDPGYQALLTRQSALGSQMEQYATRAYGSNVIDGYRQSMQDAADVAQGKVAPQDLPGHRLTYMMALTGHDPINFVSNYDHNGDGVADGQSPIGGHLDAIHTAAGQRDWGSALTSAGNLMAPYMSPHAPDHPDHNLDIRAPYGGSGDNAHIGQTANVAGSLGVANASVNSNPAVSDNLIKSHDAGATNDVAFARYIISKNGGVKGLAAKLAEPTPLEQEYGFLKTAISGEHPDWSDAQITSEALARAKPDPLAAEKLRIAGQKDVETMRLGGEQTIEGMRSKSAAAVEGMRLGGEAAQEKRREAFEAPKQKADIDYENTLKGRGRGQLMEGSDGQMYTYDPVAHTTLDSGGNPVDTTTLGITLKPAKAGGAGGLPMHPMQDPQTGFTTGFATPDPKDPTKFIIMQPSTPPGIAAPSQGAPGAPLPAYINPLTKKPWGQ